jgi:predicted ATPase
MQAVAPTGSIAITENTRRLVEGYFALKPRGPTRVKGVTEPVNVYEVTRLGPLRTRLQRSAGRGLTKFVGREREMDAMKHAAEQALAGHGQIVAAIAEAGAGKSRLFFEFKAKNQSGWNVLETFSVSHGKASAYFPVIDLLNSYFEISSEDDARKRRERVNGKVLTLDRSLEDTVPYLFALLAIGEGTDLQRHWEDAFDRLDHYLNEVQRKDPLAQMDAHVRRRRTLNAIKRILLRESLNQPLMVIFEDLHWIDEETQAFLNLLADSIANAKILLLVNYRPEYSHQWNSKTFYTQLRLDPLGRESADEMLSALLGENPELGRLKRVIIERTEGNPFFMEETVQVLLDEGALIRDGNAVRLTRPLAELKIPPTVQGILAARIDRLPADAKDLLQTLSVIGRQFPMSLIGAVVSKARDHLDRLLNDLQLGEFIYEQPAVGDTEYVFKHALTQEVAYNSVLLERRRQMHQNIGAAIESLYADSIDDHLSELAHHFSRGRSAAQAVRYLTLAGRQSLARYAYREAQAQLREAVRLTEQLPESPERDLRQMALATDLVRALWRSAESDDEIREVVLHAISVTEKTGNLVERVKQLNLLRVITARSGDFAAATALAERMLELAEQEGGALSLTFAYHATVNSRFYEGNLAAAETEFALFRKYREAADPEAVNELADPSVVTPAVAAVCAWATGHVHLAHERIDEATAYAIASKDPFLLMTAKCLEALLYVHLRQPERVLALASESIALSEDNGLRLPFAVVTLKAWAIAWLGDPAQAVTLLEGLEPSPGANAFFNALINHCEVHLLAGLPDSDAIEKALSGDLPDNLKPEQNRVRGEVRLALGQRDAAEADFRAAIALAQDMQAKAWELRATTSLARLLDQQGKRDEARTMLAEIYNWFTQGFDTADLKDAKSLLDELST